MITPRQSEPDGHCDNSSSSSRKTLSPEERDDCFYDDSHILKENTVTTTTKQLEKLFVGFFSRLLCCSAHPLTKEEHEEINKYRRTIVKRTFDKKETATNTKVNKILVLPSQWGKVVTEYISGLAVAMRMVWTQVSRQQCEGGAQRWRCYQVFVHFVEGTELKRTRNMRWEKKE